MHDDKYPDKLLVFTPFYPHQESKHQSPSISGRWQVAKLFPLLLQFKQLITESDGGVS